MPLLPEGGITVSLASAGKAQTSDSYRMNIAKERIRGSVEGAEALAQACYKALNTERYAYVIYSWNYGIELQDLFGKPVPYVFAVLPGRITDCLMQDDRINDVTDFELSNNGGDVLCKFKVKSTLGDIELQKEVKIY